MDVEFEFKPGKPLVVTGEAMRTMFTSKHATDYPETPKVILATRRRNGRASFSHRGNSGRSRQTWGCHIFVPADVKVGETLVIEWAEAGERGTYSACAKRPTPIADAT